MAINQQSSNIGYRVCGSGIQRGHSKGSSSLLMRSETELRVFHWLGRTQITRHRNPWRLLQLDVWQLFTWRLTTVGMVYRSTYTWSLHVAAASCNREAKLQEEKSGEKTVQDTQMEALKLLWPSLRGRAVSLCHILVSIVILDLVYFFNSFL